MTDKELEEDYTADNLVDLNSLSDRELHDWVLQCHILGREESLEEYEQRRREEQ